MACSMALRTPTPLNSTDPQCEQWGDTSNSSAIHRAVPVVAAKLARGCRRFGLPVTAQVRAAGFACGFHLFVGSYVGLRRSNVRPGARNLTFVTFRESLVHTLDYTPATLDPQDALLDVAIRTSDGQS